MSEIYVQPNVLEGKSERYERILEYAAQVADAACGTLPYQQETTYYKQLADQRLGASSPIEHGAFAPAD